MNDIAADQTHENKVIPWFASKGRHGHPGKDYFARCSMGLTAPTVGVPVFHAVRAPTGGKLQVLLTRIIKRLMEFLTRANEPGAERT